MLTHRGYSDKVVEFYAAVYYRSHNNIATVLVNGVPLFSYLTEMT